MYSINQKQRSFTKKKKKKKLLGCECRQDAGATSQDLKLTANNADRETERKRIKHGKIFLIL